MASTSSGVRVRDRSRIYLIGFSSHQITGSKLPSNLQVLKSLFYNIREIGLNIRDAAHLTLAEVYLFWEKARIPSQLKKNTVLKVEKLYNEWRALKKSVSDRQKPRGKSSDVQIQTR